MAARAVDSDEVSHFSYEPSLADDSLVPTAGVDECSGQVLVNATERREGEGVEHQVLACKSETSERSWSLVSGGGVIELDSSSGEETDPVDTTSSSSDEDGAINNSARRPVQRPRVPDELKLIQHRKLRTLHLMEQQNQRVMLCGRMAEASRYEPVQETRFDTPCCHTCWRKIKEYQ